MGTVRVSCWGGVAAGIAKEPLGVVSITTSGANAQSAAIPVGTEVVSVYGAEDHYIAIAANPDATGQTRFFVPAKSERDIRLASAATSGGTKIGAVTA